MESDRNYKLKIFFVTFCCLLAALSTVSRLRHTLPGSGTWDFPIFTSYANQFLATGELYNRNLDAYAPNAAVYKFPPLSGSILVTALKAGFTEIQLKSTGALMQLASFFGGLLWLTLVLMPERRLAASALALFLTAALLPTLEENILRLQLEPALLFLSIIAAIGVYKDRNFIAGFMIGIATLLKIYPVMALLYFLLAKRWHAFSGFATAALLASAFSLITLGYTEHSFYVLKILPVLLQENPITDAENISIGRLLILFNLDMSYTKTLSRIILLAPILIYHTLIKRSETVKNTNTRNQINTLIFSLFIPFTLAGMNNTLWNYQLLLALPLTALSCLLLNTALFTRNNIQPWSLAGLLFILTSLYLTASITVDNNFYSAKLIVGVAAILDRIIIPVLVIAHSWHSINACIKKARVIADTGL